MIDDNKEVRIVIELAQISSRSMYPCNFGQEGIITTCQVHLTFIQHEQKVWNSMYPESFFVFFLGGGWGWVGIGWLVLNENSRLGFTSCHLRTNKPRGGQVFVFESIRGTFHVQWFNKPYSMELFPSPTEETILPSFQGIFSNTNLHCTWSNHLTHNHNTRFSLSFAHYLECIDLWLKLIAGRFLLTL